MFFAIENKLIESAGEAYGGNLQLARSRNDLGYALTRLALRPLLLEAMDDLLGLRQSLLEFAREHLQTLMPRVYAYTAGATDDDGALYRRCAGRFGARLRASPFRL